MFTPIVVPWDGSMFADRAIPYAVRLARSLNGQLLLVRVVSDDESEPDADAELARVRERLSLIGVSAQAKLSTGNPASTIVALANQEPESIIVMSTHGRSGMSRWLSGSVADDVLRHTNVPVILVPSGCNSDWGENHPFRILVPLDGSHFSEQACTIVRPLAHSLNADVILLRVVDPSSQAYTTGLIGDTRVPPSEITSALTYLDDCARTEAWLDRTPIVRTVVGHPDSAIAKVALELGVDLIAMATHGRSGLLRLVLGSVANVTVQEANVPVLLTKLTEVEKADLQNGILLAS